MKFAKHIFFLALLLVIALNIFIRSGFFIEPVTVQVSPIVSGLSIWGSQSDGKIHPLDEINKRQELINSVVLQVPVATAQQLHSVSITIGSHNFKLDQPLQHWPQQIVWKEGSQIVFLESPSAVRLKSFLFREAINWGGFFNFNNSSQRNIFWLVISGIFAVYLLLISQLKNIRSTLAPWLERRINIWSSPVSAAGKFLTKEVWIGLIFLLACLVYLEFRDPYYFSQDDNLTQFLPVILQACEGFFTTGMFPMINPYQVMGSPNAVLGTYALTYPITYFAYLIATYLLQNPYATLEVFAFIHFIGGYFVLIWFFRLKGMAPMVSVLAALSFLLCGYNLIVGRSWYYMVPLIVWLPLLMAAVEIFRVRPSNQWVLLTGLALGIFFHAGNAQMWIYTVMFLVIALSVVIWQSDQKRLRLFYAIMALILAITIAAPLLWTMFTIVQEVDRLGGQGSGIAPGLWALMFPYPFVKASHDIFYQNTLGHLAGQLYYAGTFFTLAGIYGVIIYLLQMVFGGKGRLPPMVWIFPVVLAFILALGEDGLLWTWLAQISPFSKFNHPFKFLPFLHLFLITIGAVVINHLWRQGKLSKKAKYVMCLCVFLVLFYQVTLSQKALRIFAADPYPALSEEMKKIVSVIIAENVRICAKHDPEPGKDFMVTLPFTMVRNFATVYRLPSLSGYEPLLLGIKNDAERMAQYGVKYVFLDSALNLFSTIPSLTSVGNQIKQVSLKEVAIYQIPDALPMAFLKEHSQKSFPLTWTPQGAKVDISNLVTPSDVVVNLYFRKGYVAYVDKKQVPISPDEFNRIVVQSPAGKILEVNYMPHWPIMTLGVVLLAVGMVAGILKIRSRLRLFGA